MNELIGMNDEQAIATATQVDRFAAYRDEYRRDGYVVIRNFFSGDGFQELVVELDRYIAEVVPTLPDADAFFQDRKSPETLKQLQHMVDPYFADFGHREPFVSLAEALMGEGVCVQQPEWFNKPPGTDHPTPPHQDNFYVNLDPPPLTMWLALDTADESNGCLRYLPGSHLDGLRSHSRSQVLGFSQGINDYGSEYDCENETACPAQPGDLLAHHALTIHRADANQSTTRSRRALGFVFYGKSAREDAEAHDIYQKHLAWEMAKAGKI